MKRNNEFFLPRRQSQWAIIFIVLKFLRRFIGQLWPIILAVVIGSRNQGFDSFEMAISAIGVLSMATSIISYYKYYYSVSEEELIIEKGVLKKVKLNIPFARIQSINFKQNFIHQALGVTEVEIETAGSDKSELQIDALTFETANKLRDLLLEKKRNLVAEISDTENPVIAHKSQQEDILVLETKDLIKVGLVQNHFKPVGLLLGLAGSSFAYSYTIGIDYQDAFEYIKEFGSSLSPGDYFLLILFLIPISIVYSIVSVILRYYKLRFIRINEKFQAEQGLFTKKQFTALDNKIQIFSWGQNPFERLTGLYNIFFRQAIAGGENQRKMSLKIPGCSIEKVEYVREKWLGAESGHFERTKPVSKHFFIRSAIYLSLFFLGLTGILLFFNKPALTILGLAIWALFILVTWLEWKKKRYAFNNKEIYIGGGIFGFKHSILPVYKVQNITIIQNPYQWRRDLATVLVHTAAGPLSIPYISEEEATNLLDHFIGHVEKSDIPWM